MRYSLLKKVVRWLIIIAIAFLLKSDGHVRSEPLRQKVHIGIKNGTICAMKDSAELQHTCNKGELH